MIDVLVLSLITVVCIGSISGVIASWIANRTAKHPDHVGYFISYAFGVVSGFLVTIAWVYYIWWSAWRF